MSFLPQEFIDSDQESMEVTGEPMVRMQRQMFEDLGGPRKANGDYALYPDITKITVLRDKKDRQHFVFHYDHAGVEMVHSSGETCACHHGSKATEE